MFDRTLLDGIFAPIVTPFDAEEAICYEAIRDNIQFYNTTDLRGYMPLGSNGEFQGLDDGEAAQILRVVCRYKSSGKVVVGGCGRESAVKTVAFIRSIADEGLDLAFLLPPHYFAAHMTEEHFYSYYSRVADESPVPIVLYNAPKFSSGLSLSPQLIARLARHENIVAIKNSSPVPDRMYIEAAGTADFCVIAGNIAKLYPGLVDGVIGGVISTASYLPEYCCRLFSLFRRGEEKAAEELYQFLSRLSAEGIGPMGVPGVKLGMELRGLIGGHVRNPLFDATARQREKIEGLFRENGIGPVQKNGIGTAQR